MKRKVVAFLMAFALMFAGLTLPSQDAYAATVSVYSAVSPDPVQQLFYISSDDWAHTRYDLFDGTSWQYGLTPNVDSEGRLWLPAGIDYDIYVYQVDNDGAYVEGTEVYARSMLAHTYTISYNLYDVNNNLVTTEVVEEGTVAYGDSFVFTADEWITDGSGMEYSLGSSYSQVPVSYGTGTYSFDYYAYTPEPIEAYVYYVDDRGNVLERNDLTLEYYGGDVTFNVEPNITVNGRSYTKLSGPDTITVNYFSPVLDYDIIYVEDAPAVEYPYTVKVNYIDSETGAVLGNQYETITAEDGAYDEVQFYAPDSLEISNNGSVSYYHTDNALISHTPDGTVRSYDVYYSLFDQETPYYWNIRLVDSATGNLLGEDYIEVGVDETVTYTPETQLSVGGANYLLDSSMNTTYERHYSDTSSRILYVYYNEESTVAEAEQTLSISFRSVSDNTVLYSEEVTVAAGENYSMEIPQTYETDNAEYVVLAGQGDTIEHDYFSPQRNYTVYYRDVNDLQNVDTVVTREEIVYYDNPITQQEVVYEDEYVDEYEYIDQVVPADDGVTVLANDTTGDVVTLDDEGTPLADNPNDTAQETTTLEDEETPLAETPEITESEDNSGDTEPAQEDNGDTTTLEDETTPLAQLPTDGDSSNGSSVNMPLIIGGIAVVAVIIIAGAAFIIIKKKGSAK